jgi:hypothetical protein
VSAGSCIDCHVSQSRDRGGANTTARATELSGFGLILVLICPVINTRVRFPSPAPSIIKRLRRSAAKVQQSSNGSSISFDPTPISKGEL